MKSGGFPAETVAVLPTSTTVVEVDTRHSSILTLFLENTDGTQTFAGTIERWMIAGQTPAAMAATDLASVGPGLSGMAVIDVDGTAFLRLVGTMSGAGGNVSISGADRRQT